MAETQANRGHKGSARTPNEQQLATELTEAVGLLRGLLAITGDEPMAVQDEAWQAAEQFVALQDEESG